MPDKNWPIARLGRRTFVALFGGWFAPAVIAGAASELQPRAENAPPPAETVSPAVEQASPAVEKAPSLGSPPASNTGLLTLTATEAAFITAAVDAFIPADELSPSGSDCGVAEFIDRQLAGAWGAGSRSYRAGPFLEGAPEFGEQLPLAPRDFFKESIRIVNAWTRATHGADFDQLSATDCEGVLRALEAGQTMSPGFDANLFFTQLHQLTFEGFFADPMYGGNRDKVAWRMIGYPGLPSLYSQAVHSPSAGPLRLAPRSIGDFS